MAVVFVMLAGSAALFVKSCHVAVPQGWALVRYGTGGTKVYLRSALVYPLVHKTEMLDLRVKSLELCCKGANAIRTRDNRLAETCVTFFVRISLQEVLYVAAAIGCARAAERATLYSLFGAKFTEAIRTAFFKLAFEDMLNSPKTLTHEIHNTAGASLKGYVLEGCAVQLLGQAG